MVVVNYKVFQVPRGWQLMGNGVNKLYSTAAEVDRAVKRKGQRAAKKGVDTVALIEWNPTTKVGVIVVEAVTGKTVEYKKGGE